MGTPSRGGQAESERKEGSSRGSPGTAFVQIIAQSGWLEVRPNHASGVCPQDDLQATHFTASGMGAPLPRSDCQGEGALLHAKAEARHVPDAWYGNFLDSSATDISKCANHSSTAHTSTDAALDFFGITIYSANRKDAGAGSSNEYKDCAFATNARR